MLEQLRQSSRSLIIWVLFGIIIAAFVTQFGLSGEQQLTCGANKVVIMSVNGKPVDQYAWRLGQGLNIKGGPPVKTPWVMDLLLQRELLAQAAETLGLQVSTEQAAKKLATGKISILGLPADGKNIYFEDGVPNSKIIERFARAYGLPSTEYLIVEQRKEILANLMRQTLMHAVNSTRDEVLAQYTHDHTTATIDFVKFRLSDYRRNLIIEDAHVNAYLVSHEQEVQKKYKDDEQQYKGRGPEVRVRHFLLRKKAQPKDAKKDAEKDAKKSDPHREARANAQKHRAALVAGTDFASLAKKHSEDTRSAANGGDLGWRPINSLGWGKAVTEAAKKLDVDKISDVIETSAGFHIIRIEDKREGDLTYEQVKHEIARKLAIDHHAREQAMRDAKAALEQVNAGKKLSELFKRKKPDRKGPTFNPEMFKNLSPEQRKQLLEQIKKNKSGSLFTEGPTVPASWQWGGRAVGIGAILPSTTKAVATKQAAEVPAPAMRQPTKPNLESVGPFTRNKEQIRGFGTAPDAIVEIFETLEPGQPGSKVFDVKHGYVIFTLLNRSQPDLKTLRERVQHPTRDIRS